MAAAATSMANQRASVKEHETQGHGTHDDAWFHFARNRLYNWKDSGDAQAIGQACRCSRGATTDDYMM